MKVAVRRITIEHPLVINRFCRNHTRQFCSCYTYTLPKWHGDHVWNVRVFGFWIFYIAESVIPYYANDNYLLLLMCTGRTMQPLRLRRRTATDRTTEPLRLLRPRRRSGTRRTATWPRPLLRHALGRAAWRRRHLNTPRWPLDRLGTGSWAGPWNNVEID